MFFVQPNRPDTDTQAYRITNAGYTCLYTMIIPNRSVVISKILFMVLILISLDLPKYNNYNSKNAKYDKHEFISYVMMILMQ